MTASSAQINDPRAGSAVRQPRGAVKINGNVVPGWIDFSVTNNTYFEADTFRVTYSATALTRMVAPDALYDATWFSEIATDTYIEVLAAVRVSNPDKPDPSEMTSLIYGRIDDIEYNPKLRTITLTGRDLTGALIDAKVPRDYVNQTASSIATDLAKQHNLTPVVTAIKGAVGTAQPNGDVELIQTEGSDWDLLAALARQAGFICYVQQQSLYFQPESSDPDTYQITWTPPTKDVGDPIASVVDLTFSRSLTIVKGVTVKAMSSGRINKPSVTRYYPTAPKSITPGKATAYGPTTLYTYRLPADMTPNAVEQFALSRYKLITSHAMKLTARLPGDGVLAPRGVIIKVSGTGTAYDQTYYPRSVTRTLSVEEGYSMTVEAQNFTPNLASVFSDEASQ
jgi:phage protein D